MSAVPPFPPRMLNPVALLFAIQFAAMGAMEMSGPFWPVRLQEIGASAVTLSLGSAAVYVGPLLGVLLTSAWWGRIGDRHGHRLMMVRALLGLALTQLALAFAADVWSIVALRFLQGACAGFIAPAQAYGVAITAGQGRTRLFAHLQVATNLGSLVGAMTGGLVLDAADFFWINLGAAAVCAICAVVVLAGLPHVPGNGGRAAHTPVKATGTWLTSPVIALLAVMGVLLVARLFTLAPFALYVRSRFEAGHWMAGLAYGLLAFGFILTASLWARRLEGKDSRVILNVVGGIAFACALLTACAGLTADIRVFVALHLAWGLLLGATTPVLTALVSGLADAGRQGQVLGGVQATVQFSSITGIALGSMASRDDSLHYTYFYVAALYTAGIAVALAARKLVARARTVASVGGTG